MTTTQMQPGQRVQWTSQAAGSETTKTGTIVGFIPARGDIRAIYPIVTVKISSSQDKLGSYVSQNDRYLVRVDRADKQGNPLLPWYYAPRASALQEVQ